MQKLKKVPLRKKGETMKLYGRDDDLDDVLRASQGSENCCNGDKNCCTTPSCSN